MSTFHQTYYGYGYLHPNNLFIKIDKDGIILKIDNYWPPYKKT